MDELLKLTQEEVEQIWWDDFNNEDIYCLIDLRIITYENIAAYYNNPAWDE